MSLLSSTISRIHPLDTSFLRQAQYHIDRQAKPRGSLGMLEKIACRLTAITQSHTPSIDPARIYTCAGDHGVAARGVSLFPQEVTRQMVANFLNNGAAINVLTATAGVDLKVVDAGCAGGNFPEHPALVQCKVAPGTKDFTSEPAMTVDQCLHALENGIRLAHEAKAEGLHSLGTGEMGIANTTPATALFCAYLHLQPSAITGPGTGLSAPAVAQKAEIISQALKKHQHLIASGEPVAILAALGGFEIATLTGLLLGGASLGMPLVVDGFISVSAYVAARALCPLVGEYAFFAHASAEPGFATVMRTLGETPLLDLGLRLGEGTGAALAFFLLRSATDLYNAMATFEEANVHSAEQS